MIEPEAIKRAYGRLREIYVDLDKEFMRNKQFRMNHNPIKQAFDLAETKDCVLKSTNIMSASLPSGNIAKVISIDDVTGITNETIVYTDRHMRTTVRENIGLTPIRCGIMAALAAELNYPINRMTKVGFIGNGNINQRTMEVLNILFGIESCVIRGSKENRSKNIEKFEDILHGRGTIVVDDTDDFRWLNECEVVFCCTSSYKKEDMLSADTLKNPAVIVAQDSGYLLDESFRKGIGRVSFTDHEEQLFEHYRSEFPYDRRIRRFSTMCYESEASYKKAVYLYGVAIADLIVFEEFFNINNEKRGANV